MMKNDSKVIRDAQSARKPRNAKGTILRLFQTMLHERALFVLALGLTLAGNLLGLIGPSLAGEAIDAIGAPGGIAWSVILRKCALMLDCLGSCLPAEVAFTHPEGGLFVWCTLPSGLDSANFAKLLVNRKVAVVPGATFLSDEGGISSSFRLNYSMPSDEEIVRGVEILGDCAREYIAAHRN